MASVIKNKDNHVRSGWKVAGVIVTYMVEYFILSLIIGIIMALVMAKGRTPTELTAAVNNLLSNMPYGLFFNQLIDFIAFMAALVLFVKLVDKKRFRDIGFTSITKNYKDLIIGLLFGAISFTIIFAVLFLTDNITLKNSLTAPSFSGYTLWGLGLFIIVGFKEELLSRGYTITALNEMKRPWLSILLSSVIFSAMHLENPNVKALGLINIVFVGILFGCMFVKTKNLWMPIGYHITWNYFQGNVFGFAVSGINPHGVYIINSLKDNILTGGAFGPEAGILTTIVIALGIIIVWKMPMKKEAQGRGINLYKIYR